jgi:SpoVK/Ycf46/Vps4 family AAA+-type ATPase
MPSPESHPTHQDDLMHRIEPASTWKDVALPATELDVLRNLAAQARRLQQGPADRQADDIGSPGRGIVALFSGPSGTGKTMAVEALAQDLRLGLYRVNLTQVVSKYIGETEKNLSRVFLEAADGGAILFFDEADALFGKRSEVKDAHDRYANIEVDYFLQRADAFPGFMILAGEMTQEWAPQVRPHIRFVVKFPPPGA